MYYLTSTAFPPDVLDDLREMVADLNAGTYPIPPQTVDGIDVIHVGDDYGPMFKATLWGYDENGLLELIAGMECPIDAPVPGVVAIIKQHFPSTREIVFGV